MPRADSGKKASVKQASKLGGRTSGGPGAKFNTYTEKRSGGESRGSVHQVRRPEKQ